MFFRQVQQHGDNFSYIIGDKNTGKAAIVDSSFNASKILQILKENNLVLKYVINTHGHSDHIAGNSELRSKPNVKILAYKYSRARFDIGLDDGDLIYVGKIPIKVIYTPGHTKSDISLLGDNAIFTGDTLFAGSIGRTDFPGSSFKEIMQSIKTKLLSLPDSFKIYPGHESSSTIGDERKYNPFLQL